MGMRIGIGLSLTRGEGVGGDPIAAYFATGVNGFDFDFSKTDRLFQETTGITSADDPGENIGLALESHSWGGRTLAQETARQPDLVANGSGGTTAGWTLGEDGTMSSASGWLVHTNPATLTSLGDRLFYQAITCVVGRSYEVSAEVDPRTSPNVILSLATSVGAADSTQPRVSRPSQSTARFIFVATAATMYLRIIGDFTATPSASFAARNISIKAVVGNHGLQALTNSQPKVQAGGIARADGSDDGVRTTKKMAAAGFVMGKHLTASAPPSTKVLCGASGASTDYGYCGVDTAGKGVARVGTGAMMTSDDIVTGAIGTLGFWWNGSTAGLLVNGVKVKTQVQSGAPTTANELALFNLNINGISGSWIGTDGYRFIHGDTAPDDATLLAFHNKLMAA